MGSTRRTKTAARGGGFTLVEALTVLAAVGLLTAIALPTLRLARDRAMDMHCQSQLRQIGVALDAYAMDHRGVYIRYGDAFERSGTVLGGATVWWTSELVVRGYLEGPEDLGCPSFAEAQAFPLGVRQAPVDRPGDFRWRNADYGINFDALATQRWRRGRSDPQGYRDSARLERIGAPSGTLAVADSWFSMFAGLPTQRGQFVISGVPTSFGSIHGRHTGQSANVLWADGHTAPRAIERLLHPWAQADIGTRATPGNIWSID